MAVMDWYSAVIYGTKFNQAEDKASDPVFGKCVFSRCDESRWGTEKLARCTICNAFGD